MIDSNVKFIVASGVLSGLLAKAVLRGMGILEIATMFVCLAFVVPEILIRLRFFAFLSVNRDESIEFPTKNVKGDMYKYLYNHKAVNIRSIQKRYGLSDLFWYFLAPAHAIHQEHTEASDIRYKITSNLTRKICAVSKSNLQNLAKKYVLPVLSEQNLKTIDTERRHGGHFVRLRSIFFPIFERVMFELVFEKELPEDLNRILCASAENVIEALKGGVLRDMNKRNRLTVEIERLLIKNQKTLQLDSRLSSKEWALFLQGVVFTTAVVQLSEGAAHIGIALAQHPHVMSDLRSSKEKNLPYYVVDEVLRLWPLFGDAHRMASEDIKIPNAKKGEIEMIKKGTVLIFNYPDFHKSETKFTNINTFDPMRWKTLKKRDLNYIPFGVPNNRPCPGARISRHLLASVVEEFASNCEITSVVEHSRSLPCGGIATLKPRGEKTFLWTTLFMYAYVLVDTLSMSFWQLVCGVYMLYESKQLSLAQNYFKTYDPNSKEFDTQANKPCPSTVGAALDSNGTYTSIEKPSGGQGLRKKKLKMNKNARHHFRPESKKPWMGMFGSWYRLGMIPVCAYVSTSVSTFFLYLTVYIALFWVYRFRPRAKTRTSKRNHHKVCVIGGGLSGVVTVKELLQKGHDVVGIEASKSLGGSFTETYDGCYLSVSNHWMAFSDFPVKRNDRVFLTARQYVTYLLEYAEHFNVLKHYEFETKVVSVKRCSKSKYLVTTSDGQTRSFTAVVVATGVNRKAKLPKFQGQESWKGQILHSKQYRNANEFRGKRVVMVGCGESGSDVVKEISDVTKQSYLSLRRGVSVATKYPMRSQFTSDAFSSRSHYFAHPSLISWLFSDLNRLISTMDDVDPVFAMIGKLNLEAGGGLYQSITKNENFVESLVTGACIKTAEISKLKNDSSVEFADGTVVKNIDAIVCNTGFSRSYAFLQDGFENLSFKSSRSLFLHMFHPDLEDDASFSFVGWLRPAEGGVPALSEMQARYLASVLSGETSLPSDMRARAAAEAQEEAERFHIVPHLDTLCHYPTMMERIAELVGCKPNLLWILLTDPILWYKLWFGSHQSAVYRLCGPGACPDKARTLISRLKVAWFSNALASRVSRKLFFMNVLSFVCTRFGVFEASW